jgi:galactokinase
VLPLRLFVPGRLCLFGEHSDWAAGYRLADPRIEKGYCLIAGTNQGIHATVGPHPTSLVLASITPDGERHGPTGIPMTQAALLDAAQGGGFFRYIAGVASRILARGEARGLQIDNDQTDLPVKKGLSSSAAISVLTARAFNRVYDLGLDTRAEMEIAYQGERTTSSRCGRMDQGCAFGPRPTLMTFDGDRIETTEVRLGSDLHLVLVDLRGKKETTRILSRLNRAFPVAHDEMERGVQSLLGPINRRIVEEAVEALRAGEEERLGALMTEAQGLFDRYAAPMCREDLGAPALHGVLSYGPLQPHIWGGKGVGSQGDGSAQLLARSEADQEIVIERIEKELGMPCLKLTLSA